MATTYLSRTSTSATLATKYTISFWVKRVKPGADMRMFNNYVDGNASGQLYFNATDQLNLYDVSGGSSAMALVTNRKFKDTNAFYHIVIAVDTTQNTSSDRAKIYVNGTQETSLATSTYPSQNHSLSMQAVSASGQRRIGSHNGGGDYFDGVLSHFHFIDGLAYDASTFGETDATTGIWKIKTTPTVTYGNNGFFLFKDNASVTDQSSNSNDFTVTAGTLSNSIDNPSDILSTCNNLVQMDLSNGTFTATNSANKFTTNFTSKAIAGYSTLGAYKGKYYAECKYISGAAAIFGVVRENFQAGGSSFAISNADWGVAKGTTAYYGGSSNGSWHGDWSTNDILGCALDIDNNRVTFSKNGQWCDGSGNWDEANPTAWLTLTADKTYFFAAGDNSTSTNAAWEFNFGNGVFGTTSVSSAQNPSVGNTSAIFEYTVPTGFTALSTKGMNSF